MWCGHIRDLFPTAEGCMGSRLPNVTMLHWAQRKYALVGSDTYCLLCFFFPVWSFSGGYDQNYHVFLFNNFVFLFLIFVIPCFFLFLFFFFSQPLLAFPFSGPLALLIIMISISPKYYYPLPLPLLLLC